MAQPAGLENIKFKESFLEVPEKNGIRKLIVICLRVTLVSLHRFIKDDCLTRASAIAYTTIVSLVPMLTVTLALMTITSGFNEKQDQVFDSITVFLQKNDIKIEINPYLETLRDIVSSATQIGAVGFVVLIFSATGVLRTFEAAFNQIWRTSTQRPFFDKIIFYFFIMSIGPLIFFIFIGFAFQFIDYLRSPHISTITRSADNFLWIGGERGTIIKIDKTGKKLSRLKDLKIDFENIQCIYLSGQDNNTCDPPKMNKENFIKIRNKKNRLMALTEKGVFLESVDFGQNWSITYFVNTTFKEFVMLDENHFFFIKENGEIIRTDAQRDRKFYPVPLIRKDDPDTPVVINKIKFIDNKLGFFLDKEGFIWKTTDAGENFQIQRISNHSLNDLIVLNNDIYIIVGDKGTILKTVDAGKTWRDINHKKISYEKIWNVEVEGKTEIIVLNEIGTVFSSHDLGETWQVSRSGETGRLISIMPMQFSPQNNFVSLNTDEEEEELEKKVFDLKLKNTGKPKEEPAKKVEVAKEVVEQKSTEKKETNDVLAVGEFSTIAVGDFHDGVLTWKTLSGGDSVFSVYSLLRTFIPLFTIFLFFLMLYSLIPNVRVPIKHASIGSLITSVVFLIFIWSFGIYVKSFTGSTMIIYRALAAVPIFLLSVYCLSVIILLGAEFTATIHLKERYLRKTDLLADDIDRVNHGFYHCVKYLSAIYKFQKEHKKLPKISQLKSTLFLGSSDIVTITDKLKVADLITLSTEDHVAPVSPPDQLSLFDVYEKVATDSFELPPEDTEEKLAGIISGDFSKIYSYSKESLSKIKFSSLEM